MTHSYLHCKLEEIFGIDLRSLAVYRVCLGLVILADLSVRVTDLTLYYTDFGVLPRAALFASAIPSISIHFISGSPFFQGFLFAIQFFCALGLLVGWRTRWMTVLSWFLMASLQRRNHMILGGGDDYLRLMLFWSMFVPLGARFSIDAHLAPASPPPPKRLFTLGTVALLLQPAFVYWITVSHKWGSPSWLEGHNIFYTLKLEPFATGAAFLFLQYPTLLSLLTHAVLVFESIGPFLLFCPFLTGPIRTFTTLLFILMHAGFWATMYLVIFPRISMTALTLFFPPWFWDRLLPFVFPKSLWRVKVLRRLDCRPWVNTLANSLIEKDWIAPPRPVLTRESVWVKTCVAFFMICVALWNLQVVNRRFKAPAFIYPLCQMIHLDQYWQMFSNSNIVSGWFVVPGKLKNGTDIDLFRDGAPLSWGKPARILSTFKNERRREFMMCFNLGASKNLWPEYGRYLCRQWNGTHSGDQQLESLQVVMMGKKASLSNPVDIYRKNVFLTWNCSESRTDARSNQTSPTAGSAVRLPAVAGSFYPVNSVELSRTLDHLLRNASPPPLPGKLIALLVPHAGYQFSGNVAAAGFRSTGKRWRSVILLGPFHKSRIEGAALWPKGAFVTPLGRVRIDEPLARKLMAETPLVRAWYQPHLLEHSLEVELPFLQKTIGDVPIVPLLMNAWDLNQCRQVGEAIARVIKNDNVLIVMSSDLSHFPPRDTARRVDHAMLSALETMDPAKIYQTSVSLLKREKLSTTMCGLSPYLTGLYAAKALGSDKAVLLKYANSGEIPVGGDPNRAVGYAAVALVRDRHQSSNP